jgi:hypothetical protein
MNSYDPILDHRARLEHLRLEAEERRRQSLVDQRSPECSPDTRVRAWERLHQVRLPRSPEHAVLLIVAQQTGLALAEVQAVQRQRTLPPAA